MLLIIADRPSLSRGGREQYAGDFVQYVSEHLPSVRVVPSSPQPTGAREPSDRTRVLALSPSLEGTHYQLHGGLLAGAFAAERESLRSPLRRAFFNQALRLNARRQRLLATEARMLQGAVALMVFSHALARELVQTRGVTAERVRVERPGVDLRLFRPAVQPADVPPRAGALRLAFVGHNFALKGLPVAIAALARLRRGGIDARLTVAGSGNTRAARRWAQVHRVSAHVRLAGALTQDEVAALYRSSDALVHPTLYDPFPRVVVEALACGCPVVTTARCGAAEIITPGREGFVLGEPGDAVALSDALALVGGTARRAEMRRHAAALGRQFDDRAHFRATCEWLSLGGAEAQPSTSPGGRDFSPATATVRGT